MIETSFFEAIALAFFVNAPIQIIITIGQWLLMGRFLAPEDKTISDALRCLGLSYLSAFVLSLVIWLFWPLPSDWIMYNNRISIPAVLGEAIVIPIWLKRFGYIGRKNTGSNL
jgi:hypothetical protein